MFAKNNKTIIICLAISPTCGTYTAVTPRSVTVGPSQPERAVCVQSDQFVRIQLKQKKSYETTISIIYTPVIDQSFTPTFKHCSTLW